MSILKLARDKKSKHEPKKEARGADLQSKVDSKRAMSAPRPRTTERAGAMGSGREEVLSLLSYSEAKPGDLHALRHKASADYR